MCWLMVAWQLPVDMKHVFIFYGPAFNHRLDCGLCKQKDRKTSWHISCETLQALCCTGSGSGRWRLTKTVSHHDGFGTLPALPTSPWPAQLHLDDVGGHWPEVHEGDVLTVVDCWSRGHVKTMTIIHSLPCHWNPPQHHHGGPGMETSAHPRLHSPTQILCLPALQTHTHNG